MWGRRVRGMRWWSSARNSMSDPTTPNSTLDDPEHAIPSVEYRHSLTYSAPGRTGVRFRPDQMHREQTFEITPFVLERSALAPHLANPYDDRNT